MIKAENFAYQARNGGYLGIPYKTLDCQGFVERVLKDCGYTYNWRGSNHMWRDALKWKGTREDYKATYGTDIIPGVWVFGWRNDGGEVARGYKDGEGNAYHVGIYIGNGDVIHSTTGGVQISPMDDKRFNRIGLAKVIDYSADAWAEKFAELEKRVKRLEDLTNEP